jgi:hypothetical protein
MEICYMIRELFLIKNTDYFEYDLKFDFFFGHKSHIHPLQNILQKLGERMLVKFTVLFIMIHSNLILKVFCRQRKAENDCQFT